MTKGSAALKELRAARQVVESAVVRFAGDSGDGMQLTGGQFTQATALAGNDLATFPDFPAEIRAPVGTTFGVSAFQINFGSRPIKTSGDKMDLLVAMNPAALKVNLPDLKPETILTTNTSSISITRLASGTDRPERFMGFHFMNPVPLMQLVELIRGIATDEQTFDELKAVVDRLGKTSASAEDFPAFIVNRILMPMINEAIYTLYEGVGTVESIDTSLKLGANHPMGPLALADFIGLDICLAIMNVLHDGLADTKYRPCPLLTKYVEAGWLGKKTNRAFYDYRGEVPVPTR